MSLKPHAIFFLAIGFIGGFLSVTCGIPVPQWGWPLLIGCVLALD
jgi:hypothetical protein